jgi:hypothetical protein
MSCLHTVSTRAKPRPSPAPEDTKPHSAGRPFAIVGPVLPQSCKAIVCVCVFITSLCKGVVPFGGGAALLLPPTPHSPAQRCLSPHSITNHVLHVPGLISCNDIYYMRFPGSTIMRLPRSAAMRFPWHKGRRFPTCAWAWTWAFATAFLLAINRKTHCAPLRKKKLCRLTAR